MGDINSDECEELLSTGLDESFPMFHDMHRVVARSNMRSEDYKWELERERSRMRWEDEEDDRWHKKRESIDRKSMQRNDYDAERRRMRRYNTLGMFFADLRNRPPRYIWVNRATGQVST